MRIVVFEDEAPAFKRLSKLIAEALPDAQIVAHLDNVRSGREWLSSNPSPDLIFMDIHLADGDAFDLLEGSDISSPIIFTTAYDRYALEAFKTTAIDYLLKPVKKEDFDRAIQKLSQLRSATPAMAGPNPETSPASGYKKRFVIRYGEHIRTLATTDVAYFYSEHKATFAKTFEGRSYPVDYNLDALEDLLPPEDFFRINRQYVIQLKAIAEMKIFSKARVIITLNPPAHEQPIVSSEKAARFKLWLAGEQ
jgi:two-component system LytT family response regulator